MGKFVSFEGLDGSGKSTQLARLAEWLRRHGQTVITTREPGGTPLGERIRGLVLPQGARPAPETELALMCASRAQSVREVIVPALERGEWVLCDRFHDATEAYQGGGRGLPREAIRELHRLLCRDLQPDLTLMLELEPSLGLQRAHRREALPPAAAAGSRSAQAASEAAQPQHATPNESRFEQEPEAFFRRVAEVYREIAAREPRRCVQVDASGSEAVVSRHIEAAIRERWAHELE